MKTIDERLTAIGQRMDDLGAAIRDLRRDMASLQARIDTAGRFLRPAGTGAPLIPLATARARRR